MKDLRIGIGKRVCYKKKKVNWIFFFKYGVNYYYYFFIAKHFSFKYSIFKNSRPLLMFCFFEILNILSYETRHDGHETND